MGDFSLTAFGVFLLALVIVGIGQGVVSPGFTFWRRARHLLGGAAIHAA